MSRTHTRRHRVLAAGCLAALAITGCGGGDDGGSGGSAPSASPLVDPSAPPPLVNALEIDPATRDFLLTTNRGFFRIARASGRVTPISATVRAGAKTASVGTSLELAAQPDGRLVGSGHPDRVGTLPEFLGVMTSGDGGRTWRVISRLGEADLHKIVIKHDRIYAFDAVIGALLVSRDGGRTFSEQFTPRGVPIADFEVDPDDPRRIIAASDTELYRSTNGGAAWQRLDGASGSRFVWPSGDALLRAVKDGSVQRSTDGGTSWQTAGRVDGEPYRLRAVSADELYLVIGDGSILRSGDGGRTWVAAFRP